MNNNQLSQDNTTEQGNRLIAEFVGYPTIKKEINFQGKEIEKDRRLEYHTSWDWQVPVWYKLILLIRPIVMKNDDLKHPDIEQYFQLKRKYYDTVENNAPDVGQQIIVEAITWYNTQTKTPNHG